MGDWDFGGMLLAVFAGLLATAEAALPIISIGAAVRTDGHVQHCYVESYTFHVPSQPDAVLYDLMGYRAWRTDRRMAQNLRSLDEVQRAAQQLGCVLK